jgi:hypothetical protein
MLKEVDLDALATVDGGCRRCGCQKKNDGSGMEMLLPLLLLTMGDDSGGRIQGRRRRVV